MNLSDNGRHFIEQWEGLYLRTYRDSVGVPTIGYGHTSAAGPPVVKMGQRITKEQADQIFASDIQKVVRDVTRLVKVPLTQNQFDVLVSFHFNTGALARSNVLRAVNSKLYHEVPADLMMWNHGRIGGKLVVIRGLTNRRRAEGQLWSK